MHKQNRSDKTFTGTSKRWTGKLSIAGLIVTTAISLAGCSTSGGGRYIEPSRGDKLTDGTAKQILENNLACDQQKNCKRPDGSEPERGLLDFLPR